MYEILVRKANFPKDTYTVYKESLDLEGDGDKVVWTGESLTELEEKYEELLKTYTGDQLLPIDVLKVELGVSITDETAE